MSAWLRAIDRDSTEFDYRQNFSGSGTAAAAPATNTPVGTAVAVDNPVLGHYPDGTDYTRVDDIAADATAARADAKNNDANISALRDAHIALAAKVTLLEAAQQATPGVERDIGGGWLQQDFSQASTGVAIPGNNTDVTIFTGVTEVSMLSAMVTVAPTAGGGASTIPAPLRGATGAIEFYVADGQVRAYDNHPDFNVTSWTASVRYKK